MKMIGRTRELVQLKNGLDMALKGSGSVTIISGEAGIGKTRVLEELVSYAYDQGSIVIKAECLYRKAGDPYLPFTEAINDYFAKSGEKMPMAMGMSPILKSSGRDMISMGLIGLDIDSGDMSKSAGQAADTTPVGVDFSLERDKMFDNVSSFFTKLAQTSTVLFTIENLHQADSGTLQLFYYLGRRVKDAKLMIVGTYRPEEAEGKGEALPLSDIISRMTREGLLAELKLIRLDKKFTAQIVDEAFGREMPKSLSDFIYQETEGNPFFLVEVVSAIKEAGTLNLDDPEMKIDISAIKIPSSVTELISRRIEQLEEEPKKVLQHAAVIGPEFRYDTLLDTVALTEEGLVDNLDKLTGMQLIIEVDTGTDEDLYKFTHNMIREVIYNDLSRAKRRLMHKKVAEVLEKERGEVIDQVIYQLAYHYQMANDIDNAIRFNIKAGNKAMTSFALEEALTYFASALSLIETADDPDKFKDREIMLLNNLGNIHHVTGDWRQALKFLGDATKLCDKDSLEMARTLRALGNVEMFRMEWNGAIKNFKRALEISEKLQDHYGMADAFSGLAWISWKTGDSEKTIVYGKKCIEHAKKIGNNAMIAKALMDIGNSYNEHLNNYDKALEYYQSALEILTKEPRKDIRQMARAMNNIGDVYMNRGEYDKAIGYFTKTLEYADKIGEARMKGFGKANIAECYLKMKEYEKAKPFLAEARTMFERLDDRYMLAQTIMYHGVMYAGLKQWDKVDEHFTTALKIQQEHNIPFGVAITLYEYGVALKERGDREKARQNLEQAKALFRQLGAQTNLEIADMELESL